MATAPRTSEAAPAPSFQEQVFPDELRSAEAELVARRREIAKSPTCSYQIGVACSGGGIRSATTCLGFFQALAHAGFLPRVVRPLSLH